VSADPNTRRLMERIDLLERANNAQLATIEAYRRRNVALTRENRAYAALMGKLNLRASSGPEIEREGQ